MNDPDEVYDYDPRKFPKEMLEAIGLVAACYAQTDSIVEMAIAGALGVDSEFGWGVTTHMSSPLRSSVLKSVAEIRFSDPHILAELDEIVEHIGTVASLRNKYVHQSLRMDSNGELFREEITSRSGLNLNIVPVTVEEAKADAETIYQAGMTLASFLSQKNLFPDFPPAERARSHRNKAARKKRRKLNLKPEAS
ncbi:MAG: hypothetical protein ACSHW2_00435 [Parasphingopyxis sp.]